MRLTTEQLNSERRIQEASVFPDKCRVDLLDTIAALTRERDTAHVAAVQAAQQVFNQFEHKIFVMISNRADHFLTQGELNAAFDEVDISSLTPAESQRSYDLRIAEAVSNEAMEWFKRNPKQIRWMENRLVSVRAEVERLKGGPDA